MGEEKAAVELGDEESVNVKWITMRIHPSKVDRLPLSVTAPFVVTRF